MTPSLKWLLAILAEHRGDSYTDCLQGIEVQCSCGWRTGRIASWRDDSYKVVKAAHEQHIASAIMRELDPEGTENLDD